MTIWDKIYKDYEKGGEAWATLNEGLIPQFTKFVEEAKFDSKKAFDIGCGTGKYLRYLKEKGFNVAGIDSSETAVKMSQKNVSETDVKCANMFEYLIPDQQYDFIYSISTIHHGLKKDVKSLIDKIYGVLLPTGKILITLPDFESSKQWNTFKDHQELAPETYASMSGPEKGLAHSFYREGEIKELCSKFKNLHLELDHIGRWIITAQK
ncbi:MAG TPA: class I SAM-dependent methyltransferase [Patescibacteria group bacterium]